VNGKKAKALRALARKEVTIDSVSYVSKKVTNTKTNTASCQILLHPVCERKVYQRLKRLAKKGVSHA
jgi:hypothetical protein